MIAYRPFRNSDPPHLVRIWNRPPRNRWQVQPLTVDRFEQLVLGRTFFRPESLTVAVRDGTPCGFVHAGFSPTDDGGTLDTSLGVVSALVLEPDVDPAAVGGELLSRAEATLVAAGARRLIGGGLRPVDPFYWGLWGGPLSTGISVHDSLRLELFQAAGYEAGDRWGVWERALAGFRPPVDRVQLQIKRTHRVTVDNDPATENWWESCVFAQVDLAAYRLEPNDGSATRASLTVWDRQHLTESLGKRTFGLLRHDFQDAAFQEGWAAYLLSEAMRQRQAAGITHFEAVAPASHAAWTKLLIGLGFQETDQGVLLSKDLSATDS